MIPREQTAFRLVDSNMLLPFEEIYSYAGDVSM